MKLANFNFFGEKLKVKTALDPSNILWENRHISKKNRTCRLIFISAWILFIMHLFFLFGTSSIYFMIVLKYWETPPGVNCE